MTPAQWGKFELNNGSMAGNMPEQYALADGNSDRRTWRERNRIRFFNASTFDERGEELLRRWLNGSGKTLTTSNGTWGEYMKNNALLSKQINTILSADKSSRTSSGIFNYQGHAEIENGYNTGYEMVQMQP